ncbi:MAG: hypothetical protein NVS4B12_11280 [Ktedonobacteraceae bacterium]
MNEHDGGDQPRLHDHRQQESVVETMLELRIAHMLQNKAALVQFTPAQRERVMRRITTRSKRSLVSAPVLVFVASLVVLLTFAVYLFSSATPHPPVTTTTYYAVSTSLNTPSELANGGRLVSLDPTQHFLVYQVMHEPGIMYTADVSDPAGSNRLAMRYARDVVWAPDGSALVTTIYPVGVTEPLLALVHMGQYMHTLGHAALAASWSPTSNQEIVYVTQENGVTKLWSTTPSKGHTPSLIATLPISSLVQRLVWSPDGRKLAFITTTGQTPSPQLLSQPGHAIYIMNMNTHNVRELPLSDHVAFGNIVFSPNGQYLTYEHIDSQDRIVLHTLDIVKQQELFTITPQHTLMGWSWSSDSNALVYSDGGILTTHMLHGAPIAFLPTTNAFYPI